MWDASPSEPLKSTFLEDRRRGRPGAAGNRGRSRLVQFTREEGFLVVVAGDQLVFHDGGVRGVVLKRRFSWM